MEDGVSKGSNLAVVLTIAGAIVLIVFGIFIVMKFMMNEGSADLQKSLSTVSEQVFQDYDQKIVTGSQVKSALTTFEGKPFAILVQTRAFRDGHAIAKAVDHKQAYLVGDATNANAAYINYNAILMGAGGGDAASEAALTTATGLNILAGGAKAPLTSGVATVTGASAPKVSISGGMYQFTTGFQTINGNIHYDNAKGGLNRSGNSEYIPASTKFQSNLIKDASGAYVGVVLRQLDN